MRAYVITIRGNEYSESCAERCVMSAERQGVKVEIFNAIGKEDAQRVKDLYALKWTWPLIEPDVCPHTGLKRHPYKTQDLAARMGCAMSHYSLWMECETRGEPILILEHDAVFINPLPELPKEFSAIMVNDPHGATPKGAWWSAKLKAKGAGIWPKTYVFDDGRPDGLAGNSAYIISPATATLCADLYSRIGVWPNDATLCRQLVPDLMETYPFVTETWQTQSTSAGY